MEDQHCIALNLSNHPNTSFFAVYDGHGGDQVRSLKHLVHLHLHLYAHPHPHHSNQASLFVSSEFHKRINSLEKLTEDSLRQCALDLDAEFLDAVRS